MSPRFLDKDFYDGNGFWICGGDHEMDVKASAKFKEKVFYYDLKESSFDAKTKKNLMFNENGVKFLE